MLQKRSAFWTDGSLSFALIVNLKKKSVERNKFINGWKHFNSYVLLKYCTLEGTCRKCKNRYYL